MKKIILLARDILKDFLRFIDQIVARSYYIERGEKTGVSLFARLDIGPRILVGPRTSHKFRMAKGSSVEARCVINSWIGDVELGENSNVGIGSIIIGPVIIGSDTTISQNVFITGENRVHSKSSKGLEKAQFDLKPVDIGDGVWIGEGVSILPGVKVGDGVVIGAGSVVTKDCPKNSVIVGNPARILSRGDA